MCFEDGFGVDWTDLKGGGGGVVHCFRTLVLPRESSFPVVQLECFRYGLKSPPFFFLATERHTTNPARNTPGDTCHQHISLQRT